MRISAQLIEGATGIHLWAEKFDGGAADIFDFQDRITASVIGLIEPQIQRAEIERARQKRPDTFDVWDLYAQAVPLVHSARVSDYDTAISLLDRAIALDPSYGPALAMASWAHERRRTFGGIAPPGVDDAQVALELVHRAVEADPDDALALALYGWYRILFRGDEHGIELCERAVALNPYNRSVLDLAAVAQQNAGDPDKEIAYSHRAIELSPGAPDNYGCLNHIAAGHYILRRFAEAAYWAQRSIDLEPGYVYSHMFLAVSLAQLGRIEDGRRELSAARAIWPEVPIVRKDGIRDPEHHTVWLEGMRLLGEVV